MRNAELSSLYAEAARFRSLAAGEADVIGDDTAADMHRQFAESNRVSAEYA